MAYAGWQAHWALGLALPVLGVLAWGRWAAPRSSRRLRDPRRLYFEQVFFAAAVGALAIAGTWVPAALLAVAVTVNALLMQRWEQRR